MPRLTKQILAVLIVITVFVFIFFPLYQGAPQTPTVRPFGDNRDWALVEEMVYVIGDTNAKIVVPKGFVTDFASIPQSLWSFGLSPHGQYSRAAVIHDYLYWAQPCTRKQSDRILVLAMKESRVEAFDEFLIFTAVDNFGSEPWQSNLEERSAGLPRVIPDEFIRLKDPNISWRDYRELLAEQGVRDPKFDRNPDYCRYGDSTVVPSRESVPVAVTNK